MIQPVASVILSCPSMPRRMMRCGFPIRSFVRSFVHSCDQDWHHRSPSSVHSPRGGGWRGKQVPNNNKASETRTPKSPSGRTWPNFGGKASERAQPSPPPGKRYSLTPFRQKLAGVGPSPAIPQPKPLSYPFFAYPFRALVKAADSQRIVTVCQSPRNHNFGSVVVSCEEKIT